MALKLTARAGIVAGIVLLSACETTPTEDRYARYYDACDQQAGVCYAQCDDYDGEDRELCQADCSEIADQCFSDVARRAQAEQSYYTLASDYCFYGRNGYWRPSNGYRYGAHGRRYSYSPWRDPYYNGYSSYRDNYYYGDRHRDDDDRDPPAEPAKPKRKYPNTPTPGDRPSTPKAKDPYTSKRIDRPSTPKQRTPKVVVPKRSTKPVVAPPKPRPTTPKVKPVAPKPAPPKTTKPKAVKPKPRPATPKARPASKPRTPKNKDEHER